MSKPIKTKLPDLATLDSRFDLSSAAQKPTKPKLCSYDHAEGDLCTDEQGFVHPLDRCVIESCPGYLRGHRAHASEPSPNARARDAAVVLLKSALLRDDGDDVELDLKDEDVRAAIVCLKAVK
jgi:hypothetical protein